MLSQNNEINFFLTINVTNGLPYSSDMGNSLVLSSMNYNKSILTFQSFLFLNLKYNICCHIIYVCILIHKTRHM